MDPKSKKLLQKVITDLVVLSAVSVPILIFRLCGDPPKRGFFCHDESIRYPYKESTVPNTALFVVGLGLPTSVIVTTEVFLAGKTADITPFLLFGMRIPLWVLKCYETVGAFGLGAACTQLITDVGKYSLGRLRPHFRDVCNPRVDCALAANRYRYITNYTCRGPSSNRLREMRLSFPSGHSSFAAYTMLFLAFYIQSRINQKSSYLLKHAAQLCCVLIAWATALSRFNDNKHHWSDITVGLLIGTAVAVITAYFLFNVFPPTEAESSSHSLVSRTEREDKSSI